MSLNLRGIFSIPASPFDEDNNLDARFLRRQVEFSILAGARAIIGPVLASEVWQLTVDERKRFTAEVGEQNGGRIPYIAGVSAQSADDSIELARFAASVGAEGVIAMLPTVEMTQNWDQTKGFYSRLAEATSLEIIVQNGGRSVEDRIPVPHLMRLLEEVDQIHYIKDEGVPSNHRVTELLQAGGDRLGGVIGGMGGRYMIDELRRGACGFAPISTFTDVLVRIHNAFQEGDEEEAVDIHEKLAMMLNIELQVGLGFAKELLRRRGLVGTGRARTGDVSPDAFDIKELELRWERLSPYFKAISAEQLDESVDRHRI